MAASIPIASQAHPGVADVRPTGWLRDPAFDLLLIAGVLALALVLGGAARLSPGLFAAVLFVDFWFLAYPHVASTFTRIAFDRQSVRDHRVLLFAVPPVVLAATAGATWIGGAVVLNTVYFYWQSYHYTRQSYGIARAYRRSTGAPSADRDWLTDVVVFAFPMWGVLHRAEQQQPAFYGAAFFSPRVPAAAVAAAGVIAMVALSVWCVRQGRAFLDSRASPGERLGAGSPLLGYTLYVLSHVLITATSYLWIAEITEGWLFINVWHNAQYLLFVWAANARRFSGGVDETRRTISWLSQPRHVVWYAAVCVGISTVFYASLGHVTASFNQSFLPVVLIAHQAVNFYHYVIDAVIWRARAPASGSIRPA